MGFFNSFLVALDYPKFQNILYFYVLVIVIASVMENCTQMCYFRTENAKMYINKQISARILCLFIYILVSLCLNHTLESIIS